MFDLAHALKAFDAKAVVQLSIGLGRELGAGPFSDSIRVFSNVQNFTAYNE